MTVKVLLPQWGMGMQDATVSHWLKHEGDLVAEGEPIVEVEAAKVTDTIAAPVSGRLVRCAAAEGDVVEVQAILAEIEPEG